VTYTVYDGVEWTDLNTYKAPRLTFPWGCRADHKGAKILERLRYSKEHFAIYDVIMATASIERSLLTFAKNGGTPYTIMFDVKSWSKITTTVMENEIGLIEFVERDQKEGLAKAIEWILDKENQDG
jgi:hypothetical protein